MHDAQGAIRFGDWELRAMGLEDALDRYEEIVGHMATDVIAAVARALEGRSDG